MYSYFYIVAETIRHLKDFLSGLLDLFSLFFKYMLLFFLRKLYAFWSDVMFYSVWFGSSPFVNNPYQGAKNKLDLYVLDIKPKIITCFTVRFFLFFYFIFLFFCDLSKAEEYARTTMLHVSISNCFRIELCLVNLNELWIACSI